MDRLTLALTLLALILLLIFIAGAMRAAGRADEATDRTASGLPDMPKAPRKRGGGGHDLGIFSAGNACHHHRILGDD